MYQYKLVWGDNHWYACRNTFIIQSMHRCLFCGTIADCCLFCLIYRCNISVCPPGYVRQREMCYHVSSESVSHASAMASCTSHTWQYGVTLARPSDPLTQNLLMGLVTRNNDSLSYWIDGTWNGAQYTWQSTSEVMTWHKHFTETSPARFVIIQ